MSKYTPEALQSAVTEVLEGGGHRKAARRWGVPRATLYRRLQGATSHQEAKAAHQRLSQVREMAQKVLEAGGNSQPLGKNWMEGFLRRNQVVKDLRARKMAEAKKAKEATKKALAEAKVEAAKAELEAAKAVFEAAKAELEAATAAAAEAEGTL
ncbi:hypothetical protein LX32DRAFT_682069 [Colletotrichum zoysiae]|uniref:HTH psq-type domain-containing protein n=1 Tax=Colletotrichum zoysiae TaxID=1216348 RepID=A0AAD9HLJ9_9PEZI|nr:hypothetical protein LX32DRAFT_682069 [Colletotrichum zoysiae]